MRLHVAPRPCESCPYRRDVPPGVWDASEYEKLMAYDDGAAPDLPLAVFHCHQENATGVPTACRGWLSVHAECVAARLAVLHGLVSDAERYAEPLVPLFASGAEATAHGLSGVEAPPAEARRLIRKTMRRGAGR